MRDDMGSYGFDMWSRVAREISAAYNKEGSPLAALARLDPSLPVLHLLCQPVDEDYFEPQENFASRHSWFHVNRLHAHRHFSMFEVPDELARAIEQWVQRRRT